MADREHGGMFAVQLPFGNEAINGVLGDPGLAQLAAGDPIALMSCDLPDAFVFRSRDGDRSTHPEQGDEVCALVPGKRGRANNPPLFSGGVCSDPRSPRHNDHDRTRLTSPPQSPPFCCTTCTQALRLGR